MAPHERRSRVGRWLLAILLVGSVLTIGSVHTQVLAGWTCLAALATGLLWYDAERIELRPVATVLFAVASVLILWTCLQLVPLPHRLLAAIAPETADIWSRCLTPLHEPGPAFASISLDPTATRVQVLRGVGYLVVFAGALVVARRQEGVTFLERALVLSASALALAAFLHPTLGAQKVFGIYEVGERHGIDPAHLAPLLNQNHLAAYVNIGLIVAFASALESREAIPRPLALALVLLLGATTVWTGSRGGTAAMLVGALLVTAMMYRRRVRRLAPMAVIIVSVGAAALLLLFAFDDTRAKFAQNNLMKVQLIRRAFALLHDHAWLGVGRGAFESTFPTVRPGTENWVFTHPENIVAQWTTEWGVPIAAGSMLAIAWALRPKAALTRSRPPAGAWAALVAVALHNLVDFNSETPGVMFALAVCAAMVTAGGGAAKRDAPSTWWTRRPRLLASALGVATVGAIALTVPFTTDELYYDERSFLELVQDRALGRMAFRDRARETMLRHPAEAYFPFVGAVRALIARDESVLPWAGRALERSPVYGRAHLVLARSFFHQSPAQARLEYRTACGEDGMMCMLTEALPLVGSYDDAIELVPEGPRATQVLIGLGNALQKRLPCSVVRLDRELADRDPSSLDPVRRAATAALDDVTNGEPWCGERDRVTCVADGLASARRLRDASPAHCDGHALVAELRAAQGELDGAYAELDAALDGVMEQAACGRRLVKLAKQFGTSRRLDGALDRLLKLGCNVPADCVENLQFAATVEEERGNGRRSFALTKKAWERSPERDDLLAGVAAKAEALGLPAEALEAFSRLAERHPQEPAWTEGARREREAATRSIVERR